MALAAVVLEVEAQVDRGERQRIAAAVDSAEEATGLQFLVYIGRSRRDTRKHAEKLLVNKGLVDHRGVLLLVSPKRRAVELVTSPEARARVSDDAAKNIVDMMIPALRKGDWVTGLELGLSALSEAAGPLPDGQTPSPEMPDIL